MEIKRLREFLYLAETLSFSTTAQHFFISSSLFSKHVSAIESELGVKLFERNRHYVELTAAGERFYLDASLVVNDYDKALSNLKALADGSSQLLRIGYLRGAVAPFLLELLHYSEEAYPNIDLAMTCMGYGELVKAHRTHKVDVCLSLILDPAMQPEYDFERIYPDELQLVVNESFDLASIAEAGRIELSKLENERLILPSRDDYPGLAEMIEGMLKPVLPLERCERYKDFETMMLRVSMGNCVGFSSGHNATRNEEGVVFVPLPEVDSTYDIGAIWPRDLDASLVETIRDIARHCARYMKQQR